MKYIIVLLLASILTDNDVIHRRRTYMFNGSGFVVQHVNAHMDIINPKDLHVLFQWGTGHNRGAFKIAYWPDTEPFMIDVKLRAERGLLTLPVKDNLTFIEGDGESDPIIHFEGWINDVNKAVHFIEYECEPEVKLFLTYVEISYLDKDINQPPVIHIPPEWQ